MGPVIRELSRLARTSLASLDRAANELLSPTPWLAARPPCEFKLRALSEPGVAMTERAVVMERVGRYVLGFQEIDQTQVAVVGGKGAHLGELSRIEGVRVPVGFCVTTDAFQRIMAEAPTVDDRLDRLSRLKPDDREAIRALSAEIRRTLEGIAIPDDLAAAITRPLARLG